MTYNVHTMYDNVIYIHIYEKKGQGKDKDIHLVIFSETNRLSWVGFETMYIV